MDFSRFTITKRYKGSKQLLFDFEIGDLTGHNRNTFDDYKSLIYFLENNPEKSLYITLNQTEDSYEEGNKLVINLPVYQTFCKTIGQNGKNRTQAFFARKLRHYSEEERKEIIANSTEDEVLERIETFSTEQKNVFVNKLKTLEGIELPKGSYEPITDEDFLQVFGDFLKDPKKIEIIVSNYSRVQLNILENHKMFLERNLDKDEKFIQNWIDAKIDDQGNVFELSDEEKKKIKKSRCLIFGLEFIDHKREGLTSSKRFDVLTRLAEGKNEYVLIELKSPNGDVFKVVEERTNNGGRSSEYHLGPEISRSIPQISDYRNLLENGTETDWQRLGIPKGKIAKCLILIGTRKENNPVWEEHFLSLRKNLSSSIEIMTYSDLILKIETTIKNLKENLQ